MPYIVSNDIIAFSLFDTDTGSRDRFDSRDPKFTAIKFDAFRLKK